MIDKYVITIVGIRHYLHDDEAITRLDEQLSSPDSQAHLLLVAENENAHSPNRAMAAYVGDEKIGYVTETDIPYARNALGDMMAVEAEYICLNKKRSAVLAFIQYETEEIEHEYTPLFSLPPISGLPMPRFNVAHDLLCAQILTFAPAPPWVNEDEETIIAWAALENPEHQIYTLAQKFAEQYGSSLSGDDMRVYSRLLETPHLPEDVSEKLRHTHNHFAATEALCLKVWQKECREANKILSARNGLWSQLAVQLSTKTQNTLALNRDIRKALTALPYDLFALHEKKPSLFASRLYHLHLSSEELDALKTYFFVYDKVRLKKENIYQEKSSVLLFLGDTDDGMVQSFQRELRRYIAKASHQSFVPGLVKLIAKGEKYGVVPRNLHGNVTAYCKTLMAVFNCDFDIPNFRKLYRQSKQKPTPAQK